MTERRPAGKIKVAFISHSSAFEGAEQSLYCLLKHLDRDRFDPVVVLPSGTGLLFDRVKELGMDVVLVRSGWWIRSRAGKAQLLVGAYKELVAARTIMGLVKRFGVDVIYTNTVVRLSGALAAKLCGIPHVWHIREILEGHPLKPLLGIPATFKVVDRLSDRVIANSRAVARQFRETDKARVVYNAVEVSPASEGGRGSRLKEEFGIRPDALLVAILGSVHPHKNHEMLVRAFGKVKPRLDTACLLIIGTVQDEDYASRLRGLIKDLGIGDRVYWGGFRTDIPEIMREFDLIAVPSLAEPFGRTTIEAMAAGLPVVATNTGASPEIVLDGVTGLLVGPDDPDGMCEAIVRILSDPALAGSMGSAGRRRIDEKFTVKRYVSDIEDILSESYEEGMGRCHFWCRGERVRTVLSKMIKPRFRRLRDRLLKRAG